MSSCLSPFLSVSVVLVLFSAGAFAETFPPSQVVWSAQQAYSFCNNGGFGWQPYETPNAVCRDRPLVVSPGSSTLLILCYENIQIGLTRTSGNSSSIEPLGLIPRTGNLTLQMTDPPPRENITFESRCENPAPAETIAHKNSWKLPNNVNPGANIFGPCCALEFYVPTNYIGDLYYQSSLTDFFFGQIIIEANVTSTTTTTPPNSTTPDSGTTTMSTTTTSTTTTTPPVPTSTPLPPNNTTTDVPTSTPTPTPTTSSTPTPTMVTNTTSPPTTINPPNDGANAASVSLTAYCCTVLTMLIVVRPSYFSVL